MNVYGGTIRIGGKQVRAILAGSQRDAAKITGISLGHISKYWAKTANDVELSVALAKPGILFYSEKWFGNQASDYKPVEQLKLGL